MTRNTLLPEKHSPETTRLKKNTHKKAMFIWGIAILGVFLPACEKIFMEADPSEDPVRVFEEIWDFTDRYYSFFEEKGVDWDALYDEYRPQVEPDMNPVDLFDLCADMLYELRDGHVNLLSSFDRSRYWKWYLDSPENFYYSIIERHYLQGNQRYVGPLQFVFLNPQVAYVYYGSFANPVSEDNLDLIINSIQDLDGLIIDVRHNGGGDPTNGRNIARRFTNERVFAGTNFIKSGPGHDDFSEHRVFIDPHDGPRFSGKVMLLTNRRSYSATTYFAQYMRQLDNVTLVGDTTGGGAGLPAFRDLPNGWLLRVSSSKFYDPAGKSIESGVPPDVYAEIPEVNDNLLLTRDPIIDKAIEMILE